MLNVWKQKMYILKNRWYHIIPVYEIKARVVYFKGCTMKFHWIEINNKTTDTKWRTWTWWDILYVMQWHFEVRLKYPNTFVANV